MCQSKLPIWKYKHPNFTIPPDIEQKLASPIATEAIQVAFNQNTDVRSVPGAEVNPEIFNVG
jgi:hypothetical protein